MKTIGLVGNKDKKEVHDFLPKLLTFLKDKGIEIMLEYEMAKIVNNSKGACSFQEMAGACECALVLGGDGTVLNAARILAPLNIPLLGINLGRLGFLSEIDIPEMQEGLNKLLAGQFYIEKRMMLKARVLRGEKVLDSFIALNDAVITKGSFSRLIRLKAEINEEKVAIYPVDGIIVSSPTGSTAYSLSSGGPIVSPKMDLMILTPICPHSLWARPLVMPALSQLRITLLSENSQVMLTMDGQNAFPLEKGDEVLISKSSFEAKFIKLSGRSFYSVLHSKLSEGDLNND